VIGKTLIEPIYHCPECHSSNVTRQEIANTATCLSCIWTGTLNALVVELPAAGAEAMDQAAVKFASELRNLIAKECALPIARFLARWGFGAANEPKVLARYLSAATTGLAKAVIEERAKIEEERRRGSA
jgi:uncharacterized membrane protein